MAECEKPKSKRDMMAERLAKRYPDKKFEDDEQMYGQIYDDYDNYDREKEAYQKDRDDMAKMFASDPRSAEFLRNWRNGGDPIVSIFGMFGPEIKDAIDDPEKQKEISDKYQEYLKNVADNKKMNEDAKKNLDESLDILDAFESKNGLSSEQGQAIIEKLDQIVSDGIMGKFSEETLSMISKAINYDADIANATEEARIAGRNDRIIEEKRKKQKGDGTRPVGGANGSATKPKPQGIFALASEAM